MSAKTPPTVRAARKTTSARHPLVGKWFHTFDEDGATIKWQGTILAEPAPAHLLVQLYEWFMGEPTIQRIIPVANMTGWQFYDSGEDMRYHYDHVYLPRRGHRRQ